MRLGVVAALITLGLAVVAPLIGLDMHFIQPTQRAGGAVLALASQAAQTSVAPMADVAHTTEVTVASAAPTAVPRYLARGRDRHDRRTRVRNRALQAIRFLA
jgi:hypothetical protein